MNLFGHRKGKKPVVLICSALSSKNTMTGMDFFAVVTARLSQNLANKYHLIIKIPFEDYNAASQRTLLRSVFEREYEFSGIILVPVDTDFIKGDIIQFLKRKPDYPLCTFDLGYPRDDASFIGMTPPPFIKVNGQHGGQCAAEALDFYFKAKNINAPRIWILKGMKGSEERISGFRSKIASLSRGAEIFETEEIPWQREMAENVTRNILEAMKTSRLGYYVHAFFCCNDEMALGARDALYEFEKNNPDYFAGKPRIKIVGFDGIRDVTIYIDTKDLYIMNTVVVNLENQLKVLTTTIEQMIEQKKAHDEVDTYEQPCALYVNSSQQHLD